MFRPILLTAIVVGMAVSSCAAKESKTGDGASAAQVTVNATDTECVLSASGGGTGGALGGAPAAHPRVRTAAAVALNKE